MPYTPANNSANVSPLGIFSTLISLISIITIGYALLSGAWFIYSMINSGPNNGNQPQNSAPLAEAGHQNDTAETDGALFETPAKMIVIGAVYLTGLVLSLLGVRALRNFWLPWIIQIYAWVVLAGILILQTLIISRLYQQEYQFLNYIKYLFLFGASLVALVGLHLVLKQHSLMPFGLAILLASLGHLYLMVYHYVFATGVDYTKVWGDLGFLFVTTIVGILMLTRSLTESETS